MYYILFGRIKGRFISEYIPLRVSGARSAVAQPAASLGGRQLFVTNTKKVTFSLISLIFDCLYTSKETSFLRRSLLIRLSLIPSHNVATLYDTV